MAVCLILFNASIFKILNALITLCIYTMDGQVSLNISGGFPPYTQDWQGYDSSALVSGNYNYVVIDSAGCMDSNQVFVHSVSDIQADKYVENVSCYGESTGNISLLVNNGIPPYVINYFDSNNTSVASNQLPAGNYSYEIIDNLGCIFSDSFIVTQPEVLNLQIQLQANFLEALPSGGTPPFNFQWWNSNGLLSSSQDLYTTQSDVYYCMVYDINNCHSDTVSYTLQELFIEDGVNIFNIYPNPVNTNLYINLDQEYDDISCMFTDVLSKNILEIDLRNTKYYQMDCSDLADGVYFLQLLINNKRYTRKILVD